MKVIVLVFFIVLCCCCFSWWWTCSTDRSRTHFVTFADAKYAGSLGRICREALAYFSEDRIHAYDDAALRVTEFWDRHGDFVTREKRGFGYWIWKPYVILDTMERVPDGDVVVYADAGCTINARPEATMRMDDLVREVAGERDGLLCFTVPAFYRPVERKWTKKSVLDYFEADEAERDSAQLMATALIIKNTLKNRRLVRAWYDLCSRFEYGMIDDSRSADEDPIFEDHRHDQSIWSMLIKTTRYDDVIVVDNDVEFRHEASLIWATRKRH